MKVRNDDFTRFLTDEHYGKWLAVSLDYSEILGFSEDLEHLAEEFKKKKVIYTRAENPHEAYAF
ncbi:MAG: hypothetical protein AAB804_02100 [Patescibacteria group bacterium]